MKPLHFVPSGKEISLFKKDGGEKASLELGVPFLGKVPFDPRIVESADRGESFLTKYPSSNATEAFNQIVSEVTKFVKEDVSM